MSKYVCVEKKGQSKKRREYKTEKFEVTDNASNNNIVKKHVINVGIVINNGTLAVISFSFLKKKALAGISNK